MKTKEFIEGIANGTFSKNDIIMLSEAFPDKKDLAWDLWMADKECLESTGKPQISDAGFHLRGNNPGGASCCLWAQDPGETPLSAGPLPSP